MKRLPKAISKSIKPFSRIGLSVFVGYTIILVFEFSGFLSPIRDLEFTSQSTVITRDFFSYTILFFALPFALWGLLHTHFDETKYHETSRRFGIGLCVHALLMTLGFSLGEILVVPLNQVEVIPGVPTLIQYLLDLVFLAVILTSKGVAAFGKQRPLQRL